MEWTTTIDAPGKVCLMQGNEAIVRGAVEAGGFLSRVAFFAGPGYAWQDRE